MILFIFSLQIKGNVALQMGDLPMYITALDDGLFTVGAPHDEGKLSIPKGYFIYH